MPTRFKEALKQLAAIDPAFYKELLDQMTDGVYFVDRDRRILYWNEGAAQLTGYKREEILGRHCEDDILCHVDTAGKQLCQDGCTLSASIVDGDPHEAYVFLRHKQGRRVPVNVRVQPMRSEDGTVIGAVEIFSDASSHYEVQRKSDAMKRMAFLDHLTQLANRRFLEMSVHTALGEFGVHKDPFGVLLIDLDGFKAINDKFGHSCGDRALQEISKTLTGALRPTDIVGRWGGDEFLAIVGNVDGKILNDLAQRCVVLARKTAISNNDEQLIPLSISVGAALAYVGESADDLIRRADALMYRSKAAGRNRATTE